MLISFRKKRGRSAEREVCILCALVDNGCNKTPQGQQHECRAMDNGQQTSKEIEASLYNTCFSRERVALSDYKMPAVLTFGKTHQQI